MKTNNKMRVRILFLAMLAYSLFSFIPFLWSISTSVKRQSEVFGDSLIPKDLNFDAYVTVFTKIQPNFFTLFANSLFVATVVVIIQTSLAAMAGYAFARLKFPGRDILFYLVLGTMMIPDQLRLVPIYQILVKFGLITDRPINYAGIFLIKAVSATSIFLMRQYFLTLPRELEDAARIDGCGPIRIFSRIMLPNAKPVIATVVILTFQGNWNDLFWPSIILQTPNHWTLPFGILQFKGQFSTDWPPIMALVVLSTLPVLLLYIFCQKYIINMQLSSAIKG